RYTVALTHAGGGSSTWRGLSVTRRREDRTSDAGAHFIYLRNPWSGDVWSPSYQPICREPNEYEATFDLEKVTFRRRDGDFETQLQAVVSPEDDVEVRRLSITNRGDRPQEIEVTSYAEIVPARSCASRSRLASLTIDRRLSGWCGSTAMRAPPRARSRWPRRTRTSRCSTWG